MCVNVFTRATGVCKRVYEGDRCVKVLSGLSHLRGRGDRGVYGGYLTIITHQHSQSAKLRAMGR